MSLGHQTSRGSRGAHRGDPVARKDWQLPPRTARERVMTIGDGSPEIIAVCAEQIGIALALFRAAVLDETAEEAILPLSDRGIRMALLEPDALQRGIGVIRIHFESSIHPVVQRRRIDHKAGGRKSNPCLQVGVREYAMESVRRHYRDFGQPWLRKLYGNGMESLATATPPANPAHQ